jgi:very-short-patch-repair endonuclease
MRRDERLLGFAREMRSGPAPAEKVLWQLLRDRRLAGFKFRRQHPIGPYIADYFCAAALVVVEADGATHLSSVDRDEDRNRYFQGLGIHVLRFQNPLIFDERDVVIEEIYRICSERVATLPPHPRHRGARRVVAGSPLTRPSATLSPRGEGREKAAE